MLVLNMWIKNGLAAVLVAKKCHSRGIHCMQVKHASKGPPPPILKPNQISPEVQNAGISGPTEKEWWRPNFLGKKDLLLSVFHMCTTTLSKVQKILRNATRADLHWKVSSCLRDPTDIYIFPIVHMVKTYFLLENLSISEPSLGILQNFQHRSALPNIKYNCAVLFLRQVYYLFNYAPKTKNSTEKKEILIDFNVKTLKCIFLPCRISKYFLNFT